MTAGAFMSNRVSRWTLAYFACALLNFVLAQALMIGGWAYPARSLFAPDTFAAVHLITLGWLTLLMFGALLQFVPVISSQPLPSQKLALAALILLETGVLGMVAGFFALGAGAARFTHCLPLGGTLVALGALLSIINITIPLLRARPLPLPGRFVLAGFAFLLATLTLGLLFALALTVPALRTSLAPLLGAGIGMHALAGFGGWFTLTAIGVSYKLLPMFMLAPEERGAPGEAVFYLCVVGLAFAFGAGIAHLYRPTEALALAMNLGLVAAAVGLVFYLADVARIYRTRRRAVVELHNRVAVGAFVALAAAALIAAVLIASGTLAVHGGVLGFVVLFGWLSGLGLTQLYKIVPFLTWLGRFGSRLGRGPVPRVQDLVDERHAMHWFHIYFAAVAVGAIAGFAGQVMVWRGALAVTAAATLMLMLEYWRAWRGTYADRPRAPVTVPPKFFEGRS
jgi:hypothetical protein